jgi:sulfate permease
MIFLILILAVFFALNMGGASFAASFAASYGGRVLSRRQASVLFLVFVIVGSVVLGQNVSHTLGREIMDATLIGTRELLIIFLIAGISMFTANMAKIPQSTSLVTVAAIAGVGTAYGALKTSTVLILVPFWIALPVLSYFLTLIISRPLYPPRKGNFWVYEWFVNKQPHMRAFVIFANCYNAFSVGTNNVANVAGPMMDYLNVPLVKLLCGFAVFYGLGAFIFTAPMKTAAQEIVPLGLFTASLISLISGSLMIIASWLGIPQSFVMLKMGAIFAISTMKHGAGSTFENPMTRKTLYTWTINPLLTFLVSYAVMKAIL